jgi:hypothetical protein
MESGFRQLTPDVARMQEAQRRMPQLTALGVVHQVPAISAVLPARTRVVCDVGMDEIFACVVKDGEAIGTGGVASCVVLTARGRVTAENAADQGCPAIGLLHQNSENAGADSLQAMKKVMASLGVEHFTTCVVGGELSLDPQRMNGLTGAIALADAANNEHILEGGRVGVTQTAPDEVDPPQNAFAGLPGLPAAVSVVATADGVYYAHESTHGAGLFNHDHLAFSATPL